MTQIEKNLLNELKNTRKETEQNVFNRRPFLRINYSDFQPLFIEQANLLFRQKNIWDSFVIDDGNKRIIEQLYLYFTGNTKFSGSLTKGILLSGPFGTGKSIILESFCHLSNRLNNIKITILHSMELPEKIIDEGINYYLYRPILIDDLGKEARRIMVYGREVLPAVELITRRYDAGSWTLATANYAIKTFTEFYGKTIAERMISMFNIITLSGNSRRKQTEINTGVDLDITNKKRYNN